MKREIFDTTATCAKVDLTGFADAPTHWLFEQAQTHASDKMFKHVNERVIYLLAHSDDGVIWGRFEKERLITSHDVAPAYSPPLRGETLQTARMFWPGGELLIWRDEMEEWTGRLITETSSGASSAWTQAFEEQHIVWGTRAESREHDFTLLHEGSQGIVHVVPLRVTQQIDEQHRPLRLVVRHYVKAEGSGFLRVDVSRLCNLCEQVPTKESNA